MSKNQRRTRVYRSRLGPLCINVKKKEKKFIILIHYAENNNNNNKIGIFNEEIWFYNRYNIMKTAKRIKGKKYNNDPNVV